ncbi:MAG: endonuclease/exonuclease/phosphatase family protein [Spirochaetales bacterium]
MNPLGAMTFNLRTAGADHTDLPRGNGWARRRPLAQALLHRVAPDVVGLQESTDVQVDDLRQGYEVLRHEELALLYRPDRLEALDGGVETLGTFGDPDPWGDRWVQWQQFRGLGELEGQRLLVLNTHLSVEGDHLPQARQVFALADRRQRSVPGDWPVLVMGDFNFDASALLAELAWFDALADHRGTFHDFYGEGGPPDGSGNPRLDFVATRGLEVAESEVCTDFVTVGGIDVFPSDHYPLWVKTVSR